MRRYLGAATVLVVASSLLILSLLLPLVAAPALKKAPLDPDSRTVSVGQGSYFSLAQGEEVTTEELQSTRITRGDVAAGGDDVAVYLTFVTNEDLAVEDEEARELSTYSGRFAFDRVIGETVNCCEEEPEGHEGLYLKFPFSTQQRDYQLWDETLGAAAPVVFQGTDEIDGLEVYGFTQSIPRSEVGTLDLGDQEASDFYEVEKELWVEPTTGIIVNGRQEVLRTFEADGEVLVTATDAELGFSEETVAANIEQARDAASQLRLLSFTIPLIALIVGLLLLALGIFIAVRVDRAAAAPPSPSATDRRRHRQAPRTRRRPRARPGASSTT